MYQKIKKVKILLLGVIFLQVITTGSVMCQKVVEIKVNADTTAVLISPYLFGRNNSLSDNESSPLTQANWQLLKDAGIKMFRENGGNNSTKYNWRRKLTSHDGLSTSFNIELIDSYGRVISNTYYKNAGNSKESETINLRSIASGIYWVRIVSDNILKTQKLIVY